jgi:hypothetical protein
VRATLRSIVGNPRTVRSWRPSTWLLAFGLGLWLIAQALPAAVSHSIGEDPIVFLGLDLTVFGFLPAALSLIFGSTAGSPWVAVGVLGLAGWFANVLLAAMLVLRGRRVRPRRATTCSIAGLVCAVAGVVALHLSPDITSVEAGTWVWLSSMAVMPLAMVLWWLVEWGGETRPETQPVMTGQGGQVSGIDTFYAVDALDPTGLVNGILLAVVVGFFVVARGILAVGGLIGLGVLVLVALIIVGWVVWPSDDEGGPTPPATDSGLHTDTTRRSRSFGGWGAHRASGGPFDSRQSRDPRLPLPRAGALTRGPHPGRRDRAEPLARPTRERGRGGREWARRTRRADQGPDPRAGRTSCRRRSSPMRSRWRRS